MKIDVRYLIPAVMIGTGGHMMWAHSPWGDSTKLISVTAQLNHAAGETRKWSAIYNAQCEQLKQVRQAAEQSLQDATDRSISNSKSAFAAGIIAGRSLERKSHEAGSSPPPPSYDSLRDDFRRLWVGGDST